MNIFSLPQYLLLFISISPFFSKLISLIEFSRHGARSPLYNNFVTIPWDIPLGQLTAVGERQHYLIGKELRNRYIETRKFLNETYNIDQIKIYSTNSTRTMMSVQSQLLGLYENQGSIFDQNKMKKEFVVPPFKVNNVEKIIKKLGNNTLPNRYQPVVIEINNEQIDKVLKPVDHCPLLKRMIKENYNSDLHKEIENWLRNKGFYEELGRIFKIDTKNMTVEEAQEYLDTITMNKYDSKPLPINYTEEFDNLMNFGYSFRMFYLTIGNESASRIFASNYFKEIRDIFDKTIIKETEINKNFFKKKLEDFQRLFTIFSAHDDNLIHILRGFKLVGYTIDFDEFMHPTKFFSYRDPPLASTIFIELHKEEDYFIRFFFNDKQITLPFCDKDCNYIDFRNWINNQIIENWDENCN